MSSSALNKYSRLADATSVVATGPESGGLDDCVAFGLLRGIESRALMLDLQKRSGARLAIAYAWIAQILFDPSGGIVIDIGGRKISIVGRNLLARTDARTNLYEGILGHRVAWVRESDKATEFCVSAAACVVDSISW